MRISSRHLYAVLFSVLLSMSSFAQTFTIGTGTGTNTSSTYPSPFNNYWGAARHQFLIRASELTAAGAVAGNVKDLAFNIATLNNANNVLAANIRIGQTATNSLTAYIGGLTTVFTGNYTTQSGWQKFYFNSCFAWDGTSNIVIEVCFSSTTSTTGSTSFWTTGLSFNGSLYNNTQGCGATGPTTSTNRPNMQITILPNKPDAKVLQVKNPPVFAQQGVATNVVAVVQNNGCTPITSFDLGYKLNGEPPVIQSFTGQNIAPSATYTATFTTQITPTYVGFNKLKVWTQNPNGVSPDADVANDTARSPFFVENNTTAQGAYQGKDFWTAFMMNSDNSGVSLYLFITATQDANVVITAPKAQAAYSQSVFVPANTVKIVTIPLTINGVTMATVVSSSETISKTALHITSDADITVYGENTIPAASTDAFVTIPTVNLGKNYTTVAPIGSAAATGGAQAEYIIVASENNTVVTIKTPVATTGHAAGATWAVTLNQGDSYLVAAKLTTGLSPATYDLTGSVISSTKPIAVLAGVQCTVVPWAGTPGSCSYCNTMVETMTPSDTWGKKFYTYDFGYKPGNDFLRVTTNGTAVTNYTVNGTAFTLASQGAYRDHQFTGGVEVISDNPVCLTQICTGGQCAPVSSSDPFMVNMVAAEQWGKYCSFLANPDPEVVSNFINVIKQGITSVVSVDGNELPQSIFVQIGSSNYYAAQYSVAKGPHYAMSETPFIAYVYGFAKDDGYGYPAGGSYLQMIAIPAELISFSGYLAGANAHLSWETAQERNTLAFAIERSFDALNYTEIGSVRAAGHSSNKIEYSYIDTKLPSTQSFIFYRLKQLDQNGNSRTSKIVSLRIKGSTVSKLTIQPQPANDYAVLTYVADESILGSSQELKIYDIKGQLVRTMAIDQSVQLGENTIVLPIQELEKGAYVVELSTGLESDKLKLIIQ